MADDFWEMIGVQLKELESAGSATEVIRILGKSELGCGDAFFEGSGGRTAMSEPLEVAGWEYVWSKAGYYYAMRAPDGSVITYIEGDVYLGNRP